MNPDISGATAKTFGLLEQVNVTEGTRPHAFGFWVPGVVFAISSIAIYSECGAAAAGVVQNTLDCHVFRDMPRVLRM